jgi:hypothetical protein
VLPFIPKLNSLYSYCLYLPDSTATPNVNVTGPSPMDLEPDGTSSSDNEAPGHTAEEAVIIQRLADELVSEFNSNAAVESALDNPDLPDYNTARRSVATGSRRKEHEELQRLADEHRSDLMDEHSHQQDAFKAATFCSERSARLGDYHSYSAAGRADRERKRPASVFCDVSAPNDRHFKKPRKSVPAKVPVESPAGVSLQDVDDSSEYDEQDGVALQYDSDDKDNVASSDDPEQDVDTYSGDSDDPIPPSDDDTNFWSSCAPSPPSLTPPSPAPSVPAPLTNEAFLADVRRYVESCIQEGFRLPADGDTVADERSTNWRSEQPLYYQVVDPSVGMTPVQIRAMHLDEIRLGRCVQIHKCNACCFKGGKQKCRFNFPRAIIKITSFKDGIVLSKRLDTNCNNYNRAIMSVLRNNHDIKFLTTGVDSKAAIFYITDYVTKSELSHIQTVTLLKEGIDKIDANVYGKVTPHKEGFNPAEDLARQRLFTFLNKLDTDVERSGQWCTLVLLGLPLEYKSHTFIKVSANSFVRRARIANPMDSDTVRPRDATSSEYATPIVNPDDPTAPVTFASQYDDYQHRTTLVTDRTYYRGDVVHRFAPYLATIDHSSKEVELSQMDPLQYVQRVTKKLMTFDDLHRTTWPANWIRFSPAHAQHKTHKQVIKDVSNPRDPHPIAVLTGYTLPAKEHDEEGYASTILALLTPYSDPTQLKPSPRRSWKTTLRRYLRDLETLDPHRLSLIKTLIVNMASITSGRRRQALERDAREQLRLEQGLTVKENDGPNDYTDGDVGDCPDDVEEYFNSQVPEDVLRCLPKGGPTTLPNAYEKTTNLYQKVHPSVKALGKKLRTSSVRPSISSPESTETLKQLMQEFESALTNRRRDMYHPAPRSGQDIRRGWMRKLCLEEGLDDDQEAAFLILALHVLDVERYRVNQQLPRPDLTTKKVKQMIFSLEGAGGTGKSRVIKAFTRFLAKIKLRHTLRIGAITGVAAANVDGSTISSMLKFGKSLGARSRATTDLRKEFQDVNIFFIDEISFVGCETLENISKRLSELKNCAKPFGGMTVILAGDFHQIQPIGTTPLYKSGVSCKNLEQASKGYLTYRKVTHSVVLKHQYRMAGDPTYADFVNRYRNGKQRSVIDDEYLKSKQLSATNSLETGHLSKLKEDPVIIVEGNEQRYHINMMKAKTMAKATGQKLFFSVAVDKSASPLTTSLRYDLLLQPDGPNTNYGAGLLPVHVGMPVTMKCNVGVELGLCNGTMGRITKITLDEREPPVDYGDLDTPHYLRYHPTVEVHYPDGEEKFQLDGLAKGVCPMSTTFQPNRMEFVWSKSIRGRVVPMKITRKQLWFLPAFAITVNSSQGRSLKAAIIDLSKAKHTRAEKPYVMLSRLTSGEHLGVQGDWPASVWTTKPDGDMLWYMRSFMAPKTATTMANVPTRADVEALFKTVNRITRQLI